MGKYANVTKAERVMVVGLRHNDWHNGGGGKCSFVNTLVYIPGRIDGDHRFINGSMKRAEVGILVPVPVPVRTFGTRFYGILCRSVPVPVPNLVPEPSSTPMRLSGDDIPCLNRT